MCAVREPIAVAASWPMPECSTYSRHVSCRCHRNWSSWNRPPVPCAAACSSHSGPGLTRFSSAASRSASTHAGDSTPRSTIAPSSAKRATSSSLSAPATSTLPLAAAAGAAAEEKERAAATARGRRNLLGNMAISPNWHGSRVHTWPMAYGCMADGRCCRQRRCR
eukprot:295297-Prymnesium_polylepis.2